MATLGPYSKGSPNIAEWLPLLGSIVQALTGMTENGRSRIQADDTAQASSSESQYRKSRQLSCRKLGGKARPFS